MKQRSGKTGDTVYGRKSLAGVRKQHIERVIAMTGGDIERAAETLRIPLRQLCRWVKELEIQECNGGLKTRPTEHTQGQRGKDTRLRR